MGNERSCEGSGEEVIVERGRTEGVVEMKKIRKIVRMFMKKKKNSGIKRKKKSSEEKKNGVVEKMNVEISMRLLKKKQ